MSGGGSIPIEGGLAFAQGFHLGGELHEKAVERQNSNLKTYNRGLAADLVQWDSTKIPMRSNSIDVLVSDLVIQSWIFLVQKPN